MTLTPSQAPDKAGLLDRAREARRRFGQQSAEHLEIARACATAAHEDYSDFDALTFERFKKDGIWNDDVAVQSALAALQMAAAALSPPPVVEEAGIEVLHKLMMALAGRPDVTRLFGFHEKAIYEEARQVVNRSAMFRSLHREEE